MAVELADLVIENGLFIDYLRDCNDTMFPDINDFRWMVGNSTHDLDRQAAHEAVCDDHIEPVLGIPMPFFVENDGTRARMALKRTAGTFRAKHAWHYNELVQDDLGYAQAFEMTSVNQIAYDMRERHTMWGLS